MKIRLFLLLALYSIVIVGCAVNPVTGENDLALISESTEIDIGKKQYLPSQQMQGGQYKLDRNLTKYVQKVGSRLAAVSDRKLPYEFVVINDSTPNAWALPGGKIAINRGLLTELDSESELAAVLSHEIVHAAARHGAQGAERGMLLKGALIAAGIALSGEDYADLAIGAASVGASLIHQKYSRQAEFEADHYGMIYMDRAGYNSQAAVSLQETFVRLYKDRNPSWLAGLFSSHPPSQERVNRNREMAAKLGTNNKVHGKRRYQQQITRLKRQAPAYAAYDKGMEALKKKQTKVALREANRAITLEPREALFYGLKGDALDLMKQRKTSLAAYNQAVRLDSGFFKHFLARGELRSRLGDSAGAKRDLERSIELLPTANAYYYLGRLAEKTGNRSAALKYYQKASSSNSAAGKAAAKEVQRLSLAENPSRYLPVKVALDRQGYLIVMVKNTASVMARNVELVVGQRHFGNRLANTSRMRVRKNIYPGQIASLKTRIRLSSQKELAQWGAQVVDADMAI